MHQEIKTTVVWLALALLLTFAGFWQAKVAVNHDTQVLHPELPPPAKTKRALRTPATPFTGDVVADYITRCEKGTTDQEIRWILEDFRNAGLDFDWRDRTVAIEEAFHRRATQHRWYHDALVDGLRLSREQSAEVNTHLNQLLEREKVDLIGPTNSTHRDRKIDNEKLSESVRDLATPTLWAFSTEVCMPWKLATLLPAQGEITWKKWLESDEDEKLKSFDQDRGPSNPDNESLSFLMPYPMKIFGGMGQADLLLPYDFQPANGIFPFLKNQRFTMNEVGDPFPSSPAESYPPDPLVNVRILHPAQLRMALLFNPEWARKIQSALDAKR
jgi:hypothetical protein